MARPWRHHAFVALLSFLNVVCATDVVVKVDKYGSVPANCDDAITDLQNFFVQSSALLYGATENTVQFSSLLIEVPTTWTDCSMVSTASTRIPRAAADVIIKDGVAETVRAVQPEGCGVKGRRVEMDLAATANSEQDDENMKAFVSEWLKYSFGLFEEHGHADSEVYPEYYWKLDTVAPNSCSNVNISGNFNESCITEPDSCSVTPGQNDEVLTSLLYSSNNTLFPQMSRVCNAATHDQDAPNKQNLLCGYRSAMEVISEANKQSAARPFTVPVTTIVQDRPSDDLIIIQDMAVGLEIWTLWRTALAQMFVALNPHQDFTLIRQEEGSAGQLVVTNVTDNALLGEVVFPASLWTGATPLDLEDAFARAETEIANTNRTPSVLVLTATDVDASNSGEDLTAALELIHARRLQVDVLTFSSNTYASLTELSAFGQLTAIPVSTSSKSQSWLSAYGGTALLASAAGIRGSALQQIAFQELSVVPGNDFLQGEFQAPYMETNTTICIVFITSRLTAVRPEWYLVTPSGSIESNQESGSIEEMWSNQVFYINHLQYESGAWSFKLRKRAGIGDGDALVWAAIDVGDGVRGNGFVEAEAEAGPLNATGLYAISVFGEAENAAEEMNCSLSATVFPSSGSDEVSLDLRDDGLIVPDVASDDGIHSQYLFDLFEAGYYATEFSIGGCDNSSLYRHWIGPAFFVSAPIVNDGEDRIPPSRITDLRVRTYTDGEDTSELISLVWTAPGDNLNDGTANYYRIYCGLSRTELTHGCSVFRYGLIRIAHEAGTTEMVNLSLPLTGVQVFFGVEAVDGARNTGEMSNVAYAYRPGPPPDLPTVPSTPTPTTTTTSPLTSAEITTRAAATKAAASEIPSTSNPLSDTPGGGIGDGDGSDGNAVPMSTFVIVVAVLCGLLLALVIVGAIVAVDRRRRRRNNDLSRYGDAAAVRSQQRNYDRPSAVAGVSSRRLDDDGKEREKQSKGLKHKLSLLGRTRTRTKTNGSLGDVEYEMRTRNARDEEESTTESEDSIGSAQIGYTSSSSDASRSNRRSRGDHRRRRSHPGHRNRAFQQDVEPLDAGELLRRQEEQRRRQQSRDSSRSRRRQRHGREVVVAGGGVYQMGQQQQQPHVRQRSSLSTSTAHTFVPINPATVVAGPQQPPHSYENWSANPDPTEDMHRPKGRRRPEGAPASASAPDDYVSQLERRQRQMEQGTAGSRKPHPADGEQPFNYIAFSQMLYGGDKNRQDLTVSTGDSRTVSIV